MVAVDSCMIIELCGIYFTSIRSLPCSATQLKFSDGSKCLKVWGTRKTGFTGGISRTPFVLVWREVRGPSLPPEKIEFRIGGYAISRCLEGLNGL